MQAEIENGKMETPEIVSEDRKRLTEVEALLARVERDPLTGAYSKAFFMEYVTRRLASEPETAYDMVCLELESYHLLHGRYGEEKCNMFMRTMVESLKACLPEDVIIGRIEDSQVMLFMKHLPFLFHKEFMMRCMSLAEGSPFPIIAINSGVYLEVDHDLPAERICRNAVLPIEGIRYRYDAFIAEYDEEIRKKVLHQEAVSCHMNEALKERQFQVYYQPKYQPDGKTILGAEALVRWNSPEMGFMTPAEFIPIFEQNGFIFELDKYILETVCMDLRRWIREGRNVVPISVNVSQTDFDQSDLDRIFETIVDQYQIPHGLIHFEITESAEAPDAVKKRIAVESFRQKGFLIELDDYGAGYSTISILGKMPVDVMKIDMSLIQNMFQKEYQAILEGTLFTARRLELQVVAEGVETEEQLEALREWAKNQVKLCIQGYYLSEPLPVKEFERIMNRRKPCI